MSGSTLQSVELVEDNSRHRRIRECKYYALNGWCKFGLNCNFSHDIRYASNHFCQNYYDKNDNFRSYPRRRTEQYQVTEGPLLGDTSGCFIRTVNDPNTSLSSQLNWRSKQVDFDSELSEVQSTSHSFIHAVVNRHYKHGKPCRYFLNGYCHHGNNCRFVHSRIRQSVFSDSYKASPDDRDSKDGKCCHITNASGYSETAVEVQYKNEHVDTVLPEDAQFNSHGQTDATPADAQPNSHDLTDTAAKDVRDRLSNLNLSNDQTRKVISKQVFSLDSVTPEQLQDLRNVEIKQLKLKFPGPYLEQIEEGVDDGSTGFVVQVTPTDPEWPFDVREIKLNIYFPKDYPKSCAAVEVLQANNEFFPEELIKFLSKSIQSWFKNTHEANIAAGRVELSFRPFLRWFDRHMEELFVEGLKMKRRNMVAEAAGLQFVPFDDLLTSSSSDKFDISSMNFKDNYANNAAAQPESSSAKIESCKDGTGHHRQRDQTKEAVKVSKRGTEILLQNMQLSETVATVLCQLLHLTIECRRCKTRHDISADAKKSICIPCSKCHSAQQVAFSPNLMHQHSSVLGYLDLNGCLSFDLPIVNCFFNIECFNCNNQLRSKGLKYGQPWDTWCHTCNSKMTISVDSAKFRSVQHNSELDKRPVYFIKTEKKEKRVRDPGIQEGKPLPSNGTCRHYKKSFRWFRFPCCGKIYPCDQCHNDKELEHEMKFATRIICGFCSKEQPFSSTKPCITCQSSFSNIGKAHWEGGKGCRDKIKMSRDDSHKYSGVGKTVSRKAKELQEKKKKKKSG